MLYNVMEWMERKMKQSDDVARLFRTGEELQYLQAKEKGENRMK